MKKGLCLTLALVMLFLSCCSAVIQSVNAQSIQPKYQNYKDIPGVTQDDINALDKLLAKKPRLVYGFVITSDAFLREDGSIGGFAPLLCSRMSELFGFEFDLYPCAWEELIDKTLSKEIDLVGDLTATPERLQKYIMTDTIAQRTVKMFTDRNSSDLSDTAKQRPIRCAFLAGGTTYPRVADSWDLPFEPVFIDDEAKVPDLLLSGEIDAFIEEGTLEAAYDAYGFIKVEEYFPLTYSPISLTTGNPELAPVINIMQKYLRSGGSYELAELYSQGYKDYLKNKLAAILTDEEKEYILSHNNEETAILAACETTNYPSSFYNTKKKEFQGVAIDVLNQVAALTDLKFKVGNKSDDAWPEILKGIENGQYSVVTELLKTTQRKDRFLWTDEPYSTDSYAMISKDDYPDVDINQILFAKVGILEGTAYNDIFFEWFPDSVNTIMYADTSEAIAALEKGEVELLMATQKLLLHLTNYLEKPGYKANIVFKYTTGSYFGFNKNEEILCSIMNKAQRFIDTKGIAEKWERKTFDYESKMLKDMFPYLGVFVALLIVALFVICLLFLKNKRISKNLEKLVEKRTNELALQTSTLTTIFESIPDIVFCKDTNFRFTRCNKSFEEYFGWCEQDIIGKEDSAGLGMTDEEIENFRAADKMVMRDRRLMTVEEYIPASNGIPRLFETIKTPLVQDGAVIGIMGISRDITQRKAVEETFKLTLDNLDACVYITEIETGKILFINKKMTEEYNDPNCVGKICWEVLQNGYSERCDFCPVPKLLESGDKDYVWEEHSTVTGKYYKNTDSIIKWHDGRLVHMQHSVDITDLIRLQQDLESASKAKGDFLSRMSHEIRTPLNAIIGMIGIAMSTEDQGRIKHCLNRADNASKHLLSVINDILDMSKIEADKFELDSREFEFEKMLMNITNVTNFRAEEKQQNFIVNLNGNVPAFILGDDLRLSQVITNLLTNAVKFTPEGGTVKLNIDKIEDGGNEITLKVEVEDNGIGISEEQQQRLFTSFEQANGSISRKFGGTGLGLAISKRIVELMGGKIWIESELGQGSKFVFTVKVSKGKQQTRAKLSEKINKDKLRILAVDDSFEVREYFTHIMSSLGLRCDVAASGPEALGMVSGCGDNPYNIFFVDWQMPEMDGVELTKRIKDVVDDNSVVFMISVAEWGTIEKEALAAGVRSFISKPLFPSTLVNAINECIELEPKKTVPDATDMPCASRSATFEGYTILIAEDVEINREIMSAVLDGTGLSIDYAEDGRMAVSMFNENPDKYSLIFMDIHMPEMDGYEATRTIRALESAQSKDIPIVAMTANVFREDIESCLAVGMNDHIGKPVDPDNLFSKLEQYLRQKTGA